MENMVISPAFWENKHVLITGHTGFKGSWLSLWLHSLGANVTGFALQPQTEPSLFHVLNLEQHINHIKGDVRDLTKLLAVFNDAKPEIVIHMAAQSLVSESYETPVETYSTNVMGTVNVLEAIRHSPTVKAGIIVTSDKCYENREQMWGYRESEAMGGYDPYSNSKGCAELVTSAYRSSFFNDKNYQAHGKAIASVRAGNVIGGGDWAEKRLIPDILKALSKKEPVILRHPNAIRPWQHVLEPLGGYLQLAEKLYAQGPVYAGGWNFGPDENDTQTVEAITAKLVSHWGNDASYKVENNNSYAHEAQTLRLDCTKARTLLKWQPRWNLETTLNQISTWHKAFLSGTNMHDYCLNEIKQYQQSA
jgi:CDP-glucose 4,6-dehydratase